MYIYIYMYYVYIYIYIYIQQDTQHEHILEWLSYIGMQEMKLYWLRSNNFSIKRYYFVCKYYILKILFLTQQSRNFWYSTEISTIWARILFNSSPSVSLREKWRIWKRWGFKFWIFRTQKLLPCGRNFYHFTQTWPKIKTAEISTARMSRIKFRIFFIIMKFPSEPQKGPE